MVQVIEEALRLCRIYARRRKYGPALTQHELDLYEAASRLCRGLLDFQEKSAQVAILKAERELEQLTEQEGAAG